MIVRTIPGYFKQRAELKKLERQMGEGCGGLLLSAMLESFEQTPIKTNLSTQDINIRTLFDWTRDIGYCVLDNYKWVSVTELIQRMLEAEELLKRVLPNATFTFGLETVDS